MAPDALQGLRTAVHGGDRSALLQMLGGEVHSDALQLIGDAVAAAAKDRVAGAQTLAEAWSAALLERDWTRDELAAELDDALGRRSAPPGTPLPVDLEDLSDLLEASLGEEGGRIDLQTGEGVAHFCC